MCAFNQRQADKRTSGQAKRLTLNNEPMTERITMAKREMTMLNRVRRDFSLVFYISRECNKEARG